MAYPRSVSSDRTNVPAAASPPDRHAAAARKPLLLVVSHLVVLAVGIALGIYLLPILTAPPAPTHEAAIAAASQAAYTGTFRRDLRDSDFLHWGEGTVSVGQRNIVLVGRVAPGPDYKLYLSPEFVETEADFERLKPRMVRVGDVRTFENFVVPVPESVDVSAYDTVIVWCESFSQFITAARYR
ncbi:MAG TPA: DM13 domain-containing protein [Zeimonas sp.]